MRDLPAGGAARKAHQALAGVKSLLAEPLLTPIAGAHFDHQQVVARGGAVGFGGNLLGDGLGAEMLGGLLAGVTVTGVLLAVFMSNAGGAWDNAKKSFEGGGYKMKDGSVHEKGGAAHAAAVVGDTVGDPFKDTAGPSLNILIKLMSVVALVIAPLIAR